MKKTGRYFLVALIIIFLYLAFLLVKPYIIPLIAAFFIAYLFWPMHRMLTGVLKKEYLSALIISILIVLMIVAPTVLMVKYALGEASYLLSIGNNLRTISAPDECLVTPEDISCRFWLLMEGITEGELREISSAAIEKISIYIISQGSDMLLRIPSIILGIFITVFMIYYFLKDGGRMHDMLERILPLEKGQFIELKDGLDRLIKGIVLGQLIVAVIQGALAAIGYAAVGLKSVVLLSFLTALFALIPSFGTAFIWLPASLYLIINGLALEESLMIWKGVGLLAYGAIVVSTIDNFIRPKLISYTSQVHPIIVLIGALGGLKLFGLFGFIVGPIVLTGLLTFIEILKRDIDGNEG